MHHAVDVLSVVRYHNASRWIAKSWSWVKYCVKNNIVAYYKYFFIRQFEVKI